MQKTEHFDVIIVGAGPAGLKCAETLGNSNLKVLLLEKNSEIGPKVCAGGLTGKDLDYLDLPKELIDFSYDEIFLHVDGSPARAKNEKDFVYTIDRKTFGKWQLSKLEKFNNIEIRTNTRVSEVQKGFIVANNEKITYKFLVGADGSMSIVRKYLGLETKNFSIAIQYIVPTEKYKKFEIFLDSDLFSSWYAWIFPHKNYVSIGCGCDPKLLSSENLNKNFKSWLKKTKIDVSNGRFEAFMLNCDYRGYRFGNIFLAGDAGGFNSELTGEGIYQALITGEEAGKIILNPNHHSPKIDEILKMKKKHGQIVNFLVKCGNFRKIIFKLIKTFLKVDFLRKKIVNNLF